MRSRSSPLLLGLGLVLLTLIVYRPALSYGFVNFDDGLYVSGNRHVQQGLTWSGFLWAWQANVASNWHPLTLLSHMLDCELFGMNARGHHLTNLLLHLANVWLLFTVLRRMTGSVGRSALVAALFAVHPTHVESVVWIAERKDVLSGLFFLLTLGAYHRWVRERVPRNYVLVVLLFAGGLLSKPMLVTLPCVLLLLDVWPLGRLRTGETGSVRELWAGLRPLLIEKIPLFVLSAASSAVTVYAQQGSLATLEAVSAGRRIGNALVAYVAYLGKTFWPAKLAVFYPLPASVALGKALAAGALLAVLTALALWRLRRQPYLAVGWLWYLGMLVPVIGFLQVGRQAMADRYTYLPSIGLFIALVWAAAWAAELPSRWRVPRAALAGGALALVAVLALAANAQVRTWKDSLTLFRHALTATENNYLAHLNVAVAISQEGNEAEARRHFAEVLRLQPNMAEAHAAFATGLRRWGKLEEALPHARRAARLKPDRSRFHHTLATILGDLGRKDEAMAELRKAVELSPRFADAQYGLGLLLQQQGSTDEALEHYRAALEANPDLNDLYAPMATLSAQKGDLNEAVRLYEEALRRQPRASDHFNLALTLERLGRKEEARQQYEKALEMDPGMAAARARLGALQ